LAGGLGFEPRLAESESAVLPLDDPPSAGPRSPGHRRTRRHDHPDTTLAPRCVGVRARGITAAIGTGAAGSSGQRHGSATAAASAAAAAICRRQSRDELLDVLLVRRRQFGGLRPRCGAGLLLDLVLMMSNGILVARRSASADLLTICVTIAPRLVILRFCSVSTASRRSPAAISIRWRECRASSRCQWKPSATTG
jgi:hypothetical protein